jgi:two-component system chemotaxis response regulator CheY
MAHILVVEDHAVTQRVLSKRLRDAGHTVELADNGRAGLERLGQVQVDLILSDIAMPEMDGLELLRTVRASELHRATPFVLLTASALDQQKQQARADGADGFLEKPVSSWELEAMVSGLLGEV